MDWKRLLAYVTGTVDEELLLRNEYLVTENRVLRAQIKGRLRLTDGERKHISGIPISRSSDSPDGSTQSLTRFQRGLIALSVRWNAYGVILTVISGVSHHGFHGPVDRSFLSNTTALNSSRASDHFPEIDPGVS